jgi:hypothetical protein
MDFALVARRTRGALLAAFLLASAPAFAQDLVFPPELQWWLLEAKKANPAISIDGFRLDESQGATVPIGSARGGGGLYPVLRKWNFSGDRYAYYDLDMSLSKDKDGRYSVSRDIDSAMGIYDRSGTEIFIESFGSSKGLNALCWVRDSVLAATGIWLDFKKDGSATVDLIVREYTISAKDVRIREFSYPDAFDSEVRGSLRLNWWEQRSDYFSP